MESTRCFATVFCSADHRPMSFAVADASWCVTGLYPSAWMESLCEYLRMPSAVDVHMTTMQSAPPDAKRSPFDA